MAPKKNKAPIPIPPPSSPSIPSTPVEEKPLPEPRPGTSGTEMLLITNRRQASEQFRKAQRAEKAYRAKKRAAAARQDFQDAQGHFKESIQHFKLGIKMAFGVAKSAPYVVGEKREQKKAEADQKKKAKALAKRKKLEEKLARGAGEEELEDADESNEQKDS